MDSKIINIKVNFVLYIIYLPMDLLTSLKWIHLINFRLTMKLVSLNEANESLGYFGEFIGCQEAN